MGGEDDRNFDAGPVSMEGLCKDREDCIKCN